MKSHSTFADDLLKNHGNLLVESSSTIMSSLLEIEGVTDEGTAYVDPIWHSMMHVLFHGAQHRSEAAEIVTAYGCSPGELGFFVFLRKISRDQGK